MTKRYYATGNFSKYIPFGAEKIGVDYVNENLKILAFRKDDKNILIIINDTEEKQDVLIEDITAGAKLVVTDPENDLAEKEITDRSISITAKSVNTIIF